MTFGLDGVFSWEALNTRYNADLANNLGNLVSRSIAMVEKYRAGVVPKAENLGELGEALRENANSCGHDALKLIGQMEIHRALERIWTLIDAANVFIDRTKPWALAKDESNAKALDTSLFCQMEVIRIIGILVSPFLPNSSATILTALGSHEALALSAACWGESLVGRKVSKIDSLFPRKETKENITQVPKEKMENITPPATLEVPSEVVLVNDEITIDYFSKIKLRVGQVMSAERVEKSEKLLKLLVDLGEGRERQILAGIAKHYTPESLVGRKIGVVANLKPAKLMGQLSEGMVLASSDDTGALMLVNIDPSIKIGGEIR